MAQMVKRLPAMRETQVQSLGWEDPLEKEMATHSSILAWKIPWTEETGRPQTIGSPRVGHDWATSLSLFRVITYGEGCRINEGWGAQRLLTIEKASAACVTPAQTELESSWGCCHRGMHERDTAPRQTGNKEESTQHFPFGPLVSNQSVPLTDPMKFESQPVTEPKNATYSGPHWAQSSAN